MSNINNNQIPEVIDDKPITEIINELQSKLKKIDTLDIYSKKTNDSLISHEIRISNNTNDIIENQLKVEKIFNENLSAPGFIGPSCQFKTISSCIKTIINEYNRIKIDIEHARRESREYKNKFNAISKTNTRLIETVIERGKEYTDNKFKDMQGEIVNKISEFFDKNMEMRMKLYEFQVKIDEQVNSVKKEFAELKNMKTEFNDKINNIMKEIKKEEEEKPKTEGINKNEVEVIIKEKMDSVEKNINEMKTEFEKKFMENNDIISGQKNMEFELKKIQNSMNNLEYRINNIEKMNFSDGNNNYNNNYKNTNDDIYNNDISTNNQELRNSNINGNINKNINNKNSNSINNINNHINSNIIHNYRFKKSSNNKYLKNLNNNRNENKKNNFYSNFTNSIKENKINTSLNCKTMENISQNSTNQIINNNDNHNNFLNKKNKYILHYNNNNSNISSDNVLNVEADINKVNSLENENSFSLNHHKTKTESKFNKSTLLPNCINKKNNSKSQSDEGNFYSTFSKSQKNHRNSPNINILIPKNSNTKPFNIKTNKNDDEEKKIINNIYFNSSLNEESNGIIFSNFNNTKAFSNKSFLNLNEYEKKLLTKEKMKNKIEHKLKNKDLYLDRLRSNFDICNNNKSKNEIFTNNNNNSNILMSCITASDKEKDNIDEKIMEEFFTKNNFNKDNISSNLNHFKNNASLDLYNFSISPPETNTKNKYELPPFTERLIKGTKIFSPNKTCNIAENKELKNKKKSYSVKKENSKEKKFTQKIKADLPKKIAPVFGSTAYVKFNKKDDFINNVYLKK